MKPSCERALELLWAARASETFEVPEGRETPELAEARRHLAACPPCRAFLRRDSVLAARVRDLRLCGATPCPEVVRETLARELGDEELFQPGEGLVSSRDAKKRRWPPWVEGVLAAAAAIILIAGGLTLSQKLETGLPDEAFIVDYERTALPEIARQDVPRSEVEAFYRTQFHGDGPALMLDAPVTKVAVCNLEGRMGAYVEYDMEGDRLVFYQVPRDGKGVDGDLRTAREGNLNVARWADAEYDYALISREMPREDLERLIRART
jgi:anti-sigma factor RsiW